MIILNYKNTLVQLIYVVVISMSTIIKACVFDPFSPIQAYESIYYKTITSLLVINAAGILLSMKYSLEMMQRQDYLSQNQTHLETKKIEDMLSILLPKFIRDRIGQSGQFGIQENQGDVSILFCDICHFDQILSHENENVIQFLDSLFRQFDTLCNLNGMQKIETVGKTYMAAGGLKAAEINNKKLQNENPVKRVSIFLKGTQFGNGNEGNWQKG